MHFLIETVPDDIVLMLATYVGFCLVLMALFIRADRNWSRREMEMIAERARAVVPAQENGDRLRNLAICSERHDIDCTCFVQGDALDQRRQAGK